MEQADYFIAGLEQTERGKHLWTLRATNLPAAKLAEEMFKQRGFKSVAIRYHGA